MPQSLSQQIDRLQDVFLSDRDPDGRAFVALANAHRQNGEVDKALLLLEDGLARHPDFASGHVVAGWLSRDQGDDAAAIGSFERVLELDHENGVALRSLAELVEDTDRALAYVEKLADLESEDPEVVAALRTLRAEQAEAEAPAPEDPVAVLDEPVEPAAEEPVAVLEEPVAEEEPVAAEEPAAAMEEPVAEEEPVAVLEEPVAEEEPAAVTAEPAEEIYTRTLAELYAEQGALNKAVEVYRKLIERAPGDAALVERLAELEAGPVDGRPVVPVESLAPDPVEVGPPAPEAEPIAIESLAPDAPADDRPIVPIESLAPDDAPSDEATEEDPFPWMNKL